MSDLLNPDPYNMAASEPYRPWSPYPDWLGGLPQVLLNMGANAFAGHHGAPNFGVGFQGNIYNNQQQQVWLTRHNMAIQSLAQSSPGSSNTMVEFMRGAYVRETGNEWTKELEASSQNLAAYASGVGHHMFLQSDAGTKLWDTMGGGRRQEVLGKHLSMAGKYMDDPAFANSQYSVQSTVRASEMLFNDLYGGSAEERGNPLTRWKRTAGLTTDETGQLLRGMTMRGQISPAYDRGENDPEGAAGIEAKTRRAVDKMKSSLDTRFKAIEALKEIFGANGQPNAPIEKLLNALESFTGGTQQISLKDNPMRLESIVRGLDNAAQGAGISMHGASLLMGITSQELRAKGINQAFTPQIVEDSLHYRSALQRSGAMDTPAWGMLNVDESAALRRQFRQGAIKSPMMNFLGAASRLEREGLLDTSTTAGKEMQQLLLDARNNTLSTSQIDRLLKEGQPGMLSRLQSGFGLSGSMAQYHLEAKHANSEEIYKNKLQNSAGPAQMREWGLMTGWLSGGVASNVLSGELQRVGKGKFDTSSAGKLAVEASTLAWERIGKLSLEDQHDPAKRNKMAADALEEVLNKSGMGAALTGEGRAKLESLAGAMFNAADQEGQKRGAPALVNVFNQNNPATIAAEERARARSKISGFLQSLHSGETKDDPFLRTVDALLVAGYDPDKAGSLKAVLKGMGVVDDKTRAALSQANIAGLARARRAFMDSAEKRIGKVGDELTPEQEAKLSSEFNVQGEAVRNELKKASSDKGAFEEMMKKIERNERLASGAQETEMSFHIDVLEINGEKYKDAKGKTKGDAKSADGRGGMPVGGKK